MESLGFLPTYLLPENNLMHLLPGFFFFSCLYTVWILVAAHQERNPRKSVGGQKIQ